MDSFIDNSDEMGRFHYNDQSETPRLCSGGCGFFGSEANRGFCSKCYEDYLKRQIVKSAEREPKIDQDPVVNLTDAMNSCTISTTKKRCGCCNKRVGLLGFECRCGGTFCGIHRYAESHACDFDYKTAGRLVLQKQNPVCRGDKIRDRS